MLTKEILNFVVPKGVVEGDELVVRQANNGRYFVMILPLGKLKKDRDIEIENTREEFINNGLKDLKIPDKKDGN